MLAVALLAVRAKAVATEVQAVCHFDSPEVAAACFGTEAEGEYSDYLGKE